MYKNAWGCFSSIVRYEGVKGIFRGLTAPLIGGALETGVNYAVFERTKHALRGKYSEQVAVPASAAFSGLCLSFIVSPVELIKCRMQLGASDKGHNYKGPMDCMKQLVAREGYKGIFRGLGATMIREVPGNAIFFVSYVHVRDALQGRNHTIGKSVVGEEFLIENSSIWNIVKNASCAMFAGAISGVLMWTAVLPLDACKTRIQTAWPGTSQDVGIYIHMQRLWQEGRWKSLYAGISPTLIRAAPANAAQWLTWELCVDLSRKWRQ